MAMANGLIRQCPGFPAEAALAPLLPAIFAKIGLNSSLIPVHIIKVKNNVPRYLIMEFSAAEQEQLAADEDVMAISKRLIEKNRQAYEVLAK